MSLLTGVHILPLRLYLCIATFVWEVPCMPLSGRFLCLCNVYETSEAELNRFPPFFLFSFHTDGEAEYQHKIPVMKRQCEWSYC